MGPETSSAPPALIVRDVHVDYKVFVQASMSIKHRIANRRLRREARTIHAVRGVSVGVDEGESVGLIGSNGSGKSTLLTAMCGLVPVTSGQILVRSRPTLLGVGAALRPALSGRVNMMIGGLALGMTKREIEDRLDEMIEFSGLRQSIDLPMQTYSSGMRARLAFTIATTRSPDILLIDEALAVGDAAFKAKSSRRISEIRQNAGAVILVSHSMAEITDSCDRVYWLENGEIRAEGSPPTVVAEYQRWIAAQAS